MEWLNIIKELLLLSAGKIIYKITLFSSITMFCLSFFEGIFSNMYIELIKTVCTLLLIYCLSHFIVEFISSCKQRFSTFCFNHRKKQAAKEAALNSEKERITENNRLRALLLFLSSEDSSLLRYVYSTRSHAAYVPCNNNVALKLQEQGCLYSLKKPEVRANGYKEECECYYYKIPKDIVKFLDLHISELGEKWGAEFRPLGLQKYQRAGKAVVLE